MANYSDPDYTPDESEDSDVEIFSESSRATKRSRTVFHSDNDSYSSSESISKKTRLVQKTDDENNTIKSSKIGTKTKQPIRSGGIVYIYQCTFCFYQSIFRYNLKEHFKTCKKTNSIKRYECPECNCTYIYEELLDQHSKPADCEGIDEDIFFCPACSYDDNDSKVVILETAPSNYQRPVNCPCCNVRIRGFRILINHLSTKHNRTIKYKCEYCQYSSLERESLQIHQKSHADLQEMGLIQCSHCILDFFTISDFKEHMSRIKRYEGLKKLNRIGKKEQRGMEEEQDKDGKDNQESSNKEFKKALSRRQSDEDDITEENASDNVRNNKVISKEVAAGTAANKGNGDEEKATLFSAIGKNTFVCNECEYQAKKKIHLLIHKELIHKTEGEQSVFKCPQPGCAHKSVFKMRFRIHLRKYHKYSADLFYPKVLKCPDCLYTAKQNRHLIIHMSRTHRTKPSIKSNNSVGDKSLSSGNKGPIFTCKNCLAFSTVYSSTYYRHVISCTRERPTVARTQLTVGKSTNNPLICKHCKKEHKETYNFAWHRFASHGDKFELEKWSLKCTICDYEHYSKLVCERHGLQHKTANLKFQKFYKRELKGTVGFKYQVDGYCNNNLLKSKLQQNFVETEEASVQQGEEFINSDEENNELITIEVTSDSADGWVENNDNNTEYIKFINLQEEKEHKTLSDNNGKATLFSTNKKDTSKCKKCDYQTKNEVCLSIHNLLVHEKEEKENVFRCPHPDCPYNSTVKERFRRHLIKYHKYNINLFYPEQLKCPDCSYSTKKYQALMIHIAFVHKNKRPIKYNKLKVGNNKPKFKCKYCPRFSTTYYGTYSKHLMRRHRELPPGSSVAQFRDGKYICMQCEENFKNMYDLAWHRFMSHRKKFELRKWRLKCEICGYENNSKLICHKHGLQHKTTHIKFQKFYKGQLNGTLGFRYLYHQFAKGSNFQQNLVETGNTSVKQREESTNIEEHEPNTAREPHKVTGKNALDNVENNNVIALEVATGNANESEKNKDNLENKKLNILQESKENKDDVNEEEATLFSAHKNGTFNCIECEYQTKNEVHLSIHKELIHKILENDGNVFKCPQPGCAFNSKFRIGLRTHLRKCHKYNPDIFCPEEVTPIDRKNEPNTKPNKIPQKFDETEEYFEKPEKGEATNNEEGKQDKFRKTKAIENDDCILLNMKEGLFVCSQCTYETKDESHLPLHQMLVHGDPISSEDAKYKCRVCKSETKYRNNLKRHLIKIHEYNIEEFYTKDEDQSKTQLNEGVITTQSKNERGIASRAKNGIMTTGLVDAANSSSEDAMYQCLDCEFESKYRRNFERHLINTHNYDAGELSAMDDSENKTQSTNKGDISSQSKNESENGITPVDTATKHIPVFFLGSEFSKYKCSECKFESKYKYSLIKHLKRIHKYEGDITSHLKNDTDGTTRSKNAAENIDLLSASISNSEELIYKCPDCEFKSYYRHKFRQHLINIHKYDVELYAMDYSENKTQSKNEGTSDDDDDDANLEKFDSQNCQLCGQKHEDKYTLDWHMFKKHGHDTEILKWHLKCSLCNYETYSKQYARRHAARHSSTTKSIVVKFRKYYEHRFAGSFKYEFEKKILHRCDRCSYVAKSWESLRMHYRNHTNPKMRYDPLRNVKKRSGPRNLDPESKVGAELKKVGNLDKENNREGINYSHETKQKEVIRIEIAPDSKDEASQSKNPSQKNEGLKQNEEPTKENRRSNRFSEDSSCFDHKNSISDVEIASESDDEENQNEDLLEKYDCLRQNELIEKNRGRYRSSEDSKCIDKKSVDKVEAASEIDDETNKSESSENDKDTADYIDETYVINKCIHPGCEYRSQNKYHLKRHCSKVHNYSMRKLDEIFLRMKQYKCPLCKFHAKNLREMSVHKEEKHAGDGTELLKLSIRCTLCDFTTHRTRYTYRHAVTQHGSSTQVTVVKFHKFYGNKFIGSFSYRCAIRKTYLCEKCDYVTARKYKLQEHIVCHDKANFVLKKRASKKATEHSDSAIGETESYTKQQILDIIGCSTSEIKGKREDDNDANFSNNEIEKALDELEEEKNETGELNPFTGELIIKSGDKELNLKPMKNANKSSLKRAKSRKLKCTSVYCKYSCDNRKELTKHIKSCSKRRKITTFTCHWCEDILASYNMLKNHSNAHAVAQNNPDLVVSFSKVYNNKHMYDIEFKADLDADRKPSANKSRKGTAKTKPNKISYKCWMCGVLLFSRRNLGNHANIHAREDGNQKLTVKYSVFRDDTMESTLIMQAEPDKFLCKKIKQQEKSPELDYDPNKPVFSCDECNFKSNEEEELKKHKNLHWTAEKDAVFKAQKWFTCSVCFFHCFDVETFKKHGEWHKTHCTSTGSIKKLGKNSWY